MKEKRPYLQVPIHKPLNVETLFISLPSFSFFFFSFGHHKHISVVGRWGMGKRSSEEDKAKNGRRQLLTIFNLNFPHQTSFRPHAHTHHKHRDRQTENQIGIKLFFQIRRIHKIRLQPRWRGHCWPI